MDVEHTTLSERCQTQKATVCDSIHVKRPEQAQLRAQQADERMPGARGGVRLLRGGFPFRVRDVQDETKAVVTQHCKCAKCL